MPEIATIILNRNLPDITDNLYKFIKKIITQISMLLKQDPRKTNFLNMLLGTLTGRVQKKMD